MACGIDKIASVQSWESVPVDGRNSNSKSSRHIHTNASYSALWDKLADLISPIGMAAFWAVCCMLAAMDSNHYHPIQGRAEGCTRHA
jgi:hypothetical protein